MQNSVKILAIGDVVGKKARALLIKNIDRLKEKYKSDFVIVNVENTTHGNGLSYKHYLNYANTCIDVMTMGNHTFGNKEIYDYISDADKLIIPANLTGLDEKFSTHKEKVLTFKGHKIKVVNILGDHSFSSFSKVNCFQFFKDLYNQDSNSIYIIDFHSEITAEKNVFGYDLDGKASLVYGTHTHVQTADERILPKGTAFISDVGMCGSKDSVIGYDYESFVKRMWEGTPTTVSLREPIMVNAILATIDLDSKKAIDVLRINEEIH